MSRAGKGLPSRRNRVWEGMRCEVSRCGGTAASTPVYQACLSPGGTMLGGQS